MAQGRADPGVLTRMFGDLERDRRSSPSRGIAPHGIAAIAQACVVTSPRVRYWILRGWFPETCHWTEGKDNRGDRRRYSDAMVEATERIAVDLGVYGKRRCDLGESEFGRRVAEAWYRSEQNRLPDPSLQWHGQRGWPDARPPAVTDYSTPEAVRRYEISRSKPPPVVDPIIDLSTDEFRELNNRGTPHFWTP